MFVNIGFFYKSRFVGSFFLARHDCRCCAQIFVNIGFFYMSLYIYSHCFGCGTTAGSVHKHLSPWVSFTDLVLCIQFLF